MGGKSSRTSQSQEIEELKKMRNKYRDCFTGTQFLLPKFLDAMKDRIVYDVTTCTTQEEINRVIWMAQRNETDYTRFKILPSQHSLLPSFIYDIIESYEGTMHIKNYDGSCLDITGSFVRGSFLTQFQTNIDSPMIVGMLDMDLRRIVCHVHSLFLSSKYWIPNGFLNMKIPFDKNVGNIKPILWRSKCPLCNQISTQVSEFLKNNSTYNKECPICLTEMNQTDSMLLGCGHAFCGEHIYQLHNVKTI